MSPEVVHRKLSRLMKYLDDLLPHKEASYDTFLSDHYRVERLIELLVMTASDIAFHIISLQKEPPPASYREAFIRIGEMGIIEPENSRRLALGAGLKNILAHDYEEIDYKLLYESIPTIIEDMQQFINSIAGRT